MRQQVERCHNGVLSGGHKHNGGLAVARVVSNGRVRRPQHGLSKSTDRAAHGSECLRNRKLVQTAPRQAEHMALFRSARLSERKPRQQPTSAPCLHRPTCMRASRLTMSKPWMWISSGTGRTPAAGRQRAKISSAMEWQMAAVQRLYQQHTAQHTRCKQVLSRTRRSLHAAASQRQQHCRCTHQAGS